MRLLTIPRYSDDAEPQDDPTGSDKQEMQVSQMTDEEWEASVPPPPTVPAEDPEPTPEVEQREDDGATDPASAEAPEVADGTQGDDPAAETEEEAEKPQRRPKGWLANDVRIVCDKIVRGEVVLPEGEKPTPHRVAKLVQKMDSLDKPPSTGAVNAVFQRWESYGYATFSTEPRAFVDFTEEGRTVGLSGLLAGRAEQRKAARAAEKAAQAAAAPASEPPAEPAVDPAPEAPAPDGDDGATDQP